MAKVTVELPSMLASVLGGVRRIDAAGDTWSAALEDAFRKVPGLRVHVCDETGALRPHVLCFVNEVNTRFGDAPATLRDGDRITIMQAVSGG